MNSGKRKAEKGKEELLGKPKKAGVSSGSLQGWSWRLQIGASVETGKMNIMILIPLHPIKMTDLWKGFLGNDLEQQIWSDYSPEESRNRSWWGDSTLTVSSKSVMDVWQQEQSEREMEDNIHRVCDFVTLHVTNSLVTGNICPPRPQTSGLFCELFATCWWNAMVDSIHPSLHWDECSPPTYALLLDFNLHLSVRSKLPYVS